MSSTMNAPVTIRRRQGESGFYEDMKDQLWRINWKAEGYSFCGVYCVSPDNGWPTKIGISQNPIKRLAQIQTHVWKRVDIMGYRYCENAVAAKAVEQKTHEILRGDGLSLHGEWFDIRAEKAIENIEFAGLSLGVETRSDIPDSKIEFWLENLRKRASNEYTASELYGV